ncbi:MAG: hypothetical protein IJX39_09605 [Clostridia bacterium]|nr:hypothetical protein [Clostridia bacterium]
MKKIVLLGDSIRQGYDKYVRMAFDGAAEVYYPDCNCRFTAHILRHIVDWKEKMNCGDDVDLVHWNAGLWDSLTLIDGKTHTSIATYRENLARICDMIRMLFPQARMIFATSTPVVEEWFKTYKYKRSNRDIERFNDAAREVIKAYGGEINDLYALLKDLPVAYHSDQTHFYTKEGTRVITDRLIDCIGKTLGIQGVPPDYDKLFSPKEDALGL